MTTPFGHIFLGLLLLFSIDSCVSQRKSGRNIPVGSDIKATVNFDCPEEFGYYPHPTDCTQYYVCVFGGALLESCTGGLMYSHELQTCDWPRNVGCDGLAAVSVTVSGNNGGGLSSSSSVSIQTPSRERERDRGEQRIRYTLVSTSAPAVPAPSAVQVSSRGQSRQLQHHQQQQHQHEIINSKQQLYADEDPAEEIENDRQQRVYRGQPSAVGQVQRDRDGLRHTNAIPTSSRGEKIGVISFGTQQQQQQPIQQYRNDTMYFDSLTNDLTEKRRRKRQVRHSSRLEEPSVSTQSHLSGSSQSVSSGRTLYNGSQQYDPAQYDPYYTLYEDDVELYRDVDYAQQQQQQQPQQYTSNRAQQTSPQHTYRGTPAPISVPIQATEQKESTPQRNTGYINSGYSTKAQDVYASVPDYQEDNYNTQVDDQTYSQPSRQQSRGDRNELNYFLETSPKSTTIRTTTTITTTTTPRPNLAQKQSVISPRSPISAIVNKTRPQSIIITLSANPGQNINPINQTTLLLNKTTNPENEHNNNSSNPQITSQLISLKTGFSFRQFTDSNLTPVTYKPISLSSSLLDSVSTTETPPSRIANLSKPAPFSLTKLPNADQKSVIFQLSSHLGHLKTDPVENIPIPLTTENPSKREIENGPIKNLAINSRNSQNDVHIIPTTYSPPKNLLASLKLSIISHDSNAESSILHEKNVPLATSNSDKTPVKTIIHKLPLKSNITTTNVNPNEKPQERTIISKIHFGLPQSFPQKINNLASVHSSKSDSLESQESDEKHVNLFEYPMKKNITFVTSTDATNDRGHFKFSFGSNSTSSGKLNFLSSTKNYLKSDRFITSEKPNDILFKSQGSNEQTKPFSNVFNIKTTTEQIQPAYIKREHIVPSYYNQKNNSPLSTTEQIEYLYSSTDTSTEKIPLHDRSYYVPVSITEHIKPIYNRKQVHTEQSENNNRYRITTEQINTSFPTTEQKQFLSSSTVAEHSLSNTHNSEITTENSRQWFINRNFETSLEKKLSLNRHSTTTPKNYFKSSSEPIKIFLYRNQEINSEQIRPTKIEHTRPLHRNGVTLTTTEQNIQFNNQSPETSSEEIKSSYTRKPETSSEQFIPIYNRYPVTTEQFKSFYNRHPISTSVDQLKPLYRNSNTSITSTEYLIPKSTTPVSSTTITNNEFTTNKKYSKDINRFVPIDNRKSTDNDNGKYLASFNVDRTYNQYKTTTKQTDINENEDKIVKANHYDNDVPTSTFKTKSIQPITTTAQSFDVNLTNKTVLATDPSQNFTLPTRISRVNTAIKSLIAFGGTRTRNTQTKCNENQSDTKCNEIQKQRTNSRGRGSAHYTSAGAGDSIPVNRGTPATRSRPTLKPSTSIVSKASEFIDIYKFPPQRPDAIYPQPQVDKTAAKCRKDVCLLPDCNCGGKEIPGEVPVEQVPQIVLLTFDDSVNDLNKGLYSDLFEKGRTNPNGCPIAATFYVSHEWTDYSQVQNLYSDGHEIASHTVSHSFGEQFSQKKWNREVAGQREILSAYGGVHLEDVRGMRAPFLSVGGNKMFKMLYDSNFTYDSSLPVYENRPPSWPYTLDYKLFHDCMIPPCPTRSYPGVWEVPMVMWQDLNGGRCSMGDACSNPPDADGVNKMLMKNFERHYTTNRAPFGLFYHAAWFTQPHHKEGFIRFLDYLVSKNDVFLVTNWQAIQWVRDPTPLNRINSFQPFQCNYGDRPKRCNNPKVCNLWHKSGVRYMKTCQPCPDIYPWTGKTGIRSSRIDNDIED